MGLHYANPVVFLQTPASALSVVVQSDCVGVGVFCAAVIFNAHCAVL
jgi:hypothetical protein